MNAFRPSLAYRLALALIFTPLVVQCSTEVACTSRPADTRSCIEREADAIDRLEILCEDANPFSDDAMFCRKLAVRNYCPEGDAGR